MHLRSRVTRGLSVLTATVLILTACQHSRETRVASSSKMKAKQIAIILALQGFDTSELLESKKMFEAEGMAITVVSSEMGEAVSWSGVTVPVDLAINRINVEQFDAIVFLGLDSALNKKAHAIAREAVRKDKVLAGICAGPTILAYAGVLKGRRATGYFKEPIVAHGGIYGEEFVVVDGHIITAVGPNVVKEFVQAIITALNGRMGS